MKQLHQAEKKGARKGRKNRAPAALPSHPIRKAQDRIARVFACPRPPLNVSLIVDCALSTGEGPEAIGERLGFRPEAVRDILLKAVLKLGDVLDLDRTPADLPGEAR